MLNMIHTRLLATLMVGTLIAGCASTPRPEEICTGEWIKSRSEAAIGEFKNSTDSTWKRLQKTGQRAAENGKLGLIERASVLLSLTKLVNAFQNSDALSDLQTLGETCNDPELVRNTMVETLREYNVPEPYIDLLSELDDFRQLMGTQAPAS